MFKYLHKGLDRVMVERKDLKNDEVTMHQVASYISDTYSLWRIFEFYMREMEPSVTSLPLHLPEEQMVLIRPGESLVDATERKKITMLTAFFHLNRIDPCANGILYPDILKHYSWNQDDKCYKRRKNNLSKSDDPTIKSDMIGRIPIIALSSFTMELYYLRMLMYNVSGSKSFEDLRTLQNGKVCETFHETAVELGLCEDDQEIEKTFLEGFNIMFGPAVREFFVNLILYCNPISPKDFFNKFKDKLCEDYMRNTGLTEATDVMVNNCLVDLQRIFESHGRTLEEFKLPLPDQSLLKNINMRDIEEELSYFRENLAEIARSNMSKMNDEQRAIVKDVLHCVDKQLPGLFSIDAPGGSGKTFVLAILLDYVRSKGLVALGMATTGIAATLLTGGKTVHSRLKVPIHLDEGSIISPILKENSSLNMLLKQTSLIIIDEVSMGNKVLFQAIDKTLRMLKDVDAPFGGIVTVLSADWQQCLTVVQKASPAEIIYQTLKACDLWLDAKKYKLTKNMRVTSDDPFAKQFCDFLLRIGSGTEPNNPIESDMVMIPPHLRSKASNVQGFCAEIFHEIDQMKLAHNSPDEWNEFIKTDEWKNYIMSRAVICPTNSDTEEINQYLIKKIPGQLHIFKSIDKVLNTKYGHDYPTEYLNSIYLGSIPPHILELKVGTPIILVRNLNPRQGMMNGTRCILLQIGKRVLKAQICCGPHKGTEFLIPKILFHPEDKNIPFEFERRYNSI